MNCSQLSNGVEVINNTSGLDELCRRFGGGSRFL